CLTLRQIDINVPLAVVQGHKAILEVQVRPRGRQAILGEMIRGFHVVESESNATQVVLEDVSRAISGPFSCEVTADQPSFFHRHEDGRFRVDVEEGRTLTLKWSVVVELPKKDPYIVGLNIRYKIGDILRANCTSEKSNPAANLAWYVNGQHWHGPHVHKFKYQDGSYIT
ncbi:hypothetical protein NQ317_010124, partial [Molorchus minor]